MKASNTAELTPDTIVTFLADIFERRGAEEYLGEPVTIAEHMLQGAHAAEQNGEDETIIVAALLHDIGHFTGEFWTFSMEDTEDRHHEDAGAEILERFFPRSSLTACVSMWRPSVISARKALATFSAYRLHLLTRSTSKAGP